MSHSQLKQLIKMINQIALNNHYDNDNEKTAKKVAHHIKMFWAGSMKTTLLEYALKDGSQLSEPSKLALIHLK